MITTTVAEALQMYPDLPIPAIRGIIIEIDRVYSGGNGDKAWTRQNGVLKDGTGEIQFKIWNHADQSAMKGRQVVFEAVNSERGWTGLWTNDNEYKGKVTRELKLGDNGLISPAEVQQQAPQQQPPRQAPAPHNNPAGQPANNQRRMTTLWEAGGVAPLEAGQPANNQRRMTAKGRAPVLGALVGNQMGHAINLAKDCFPEVRPDSADFWKLVKQLASNGIRISQSLEDGNLSPAPWEKSAPAGQPPPPPPPPACTQCGGELDANGECTSCDNVPF